VKLIGKFYIKHYRANKLIGEYNINNAVAILGRNRLLDVMFHGTAASGTWYIGLVDNSGYTGFSVNDTIASHTGWTEVTGYSEGTRVAWSEGAASDAVIASSATSDFSITATKTIKGIFLVNESTKGGTTGVLWATAAFAANVDVENGDTLKVEYSVEASV